MTEEMVIFTRTYDFITWLIPLTLNFPRPQRFVVSLRLQNAALDFQERIIEANAARGARRAGKLHEADVALIKIRLYLRLCERWQWINSGQYRHASGMVTEIGRLLGGWIRNTTEGITPQSGGNG